jgi:AraC-like DNA-binding protein
METGESPMMTLTRMRIHLAKTLLLQGHRLKLVADQTGFWDQYHLSKTFKQHEGISPREFCRRQAKHLGHSQLFPWPRAD